MSEPYLLTEAENALIDQIFELMNATGLSAHQASIAMAATTIGAGNYFVIEVPWRGNRLPDRPKCRRRASRTTNRVEVQGEYS